MDSIEGLENFPSKITMSFKNDSIKYKILDSIFKAELNRKNIALKYEIKHLKNDTLFFTYYKNKIKLPFQIIPNSAYFKNKETLNLNYGKECKNYESRAIFISFIVTSNWSILLAWLLCIGICT